MSAQLDAIAGQFAGSQAVTAISPLGNGLINDTYLVSTDQQPFVLQRINSAIFKQPEWIIDNLLQIQRHIANTAGIEPQLQIPALLPTQDQRYCFRDADQQVWRALQLISASESHEQISQIQQAEQIGFALGHFHRLCSSIDASQLHDTLPGFHITPQYYQQYLIASRLPLTVEQTQTLQSCQAFIEQHRQQIDILENARQQGLLHDRIIHGDPKLNNFLFRQNSHRIISLIDLDTVKPGLIHYDLGDCLRSCCHIEAGNRFDLDRCETILSHYLAEAGDFMTAADYDHLYAAIWLIPFELGLRFLTDYLQGDCYFKTHFPGQNLQRAEAQFALCADIGRQQTDLQKLITRLR